eukprot:scaffold421134_cov63-Attheya_sp.AAC.1
MASNFCNAVGLVSSSHTLQMTPMRARKELACATTNPVPPPPPDDDDDDDDDDDNMGWRTCSKKGRMRSWATMSKLSPRGTL